MVVVKNIVLALYLVIAVILILMTTFQNKDSENSAEDTYENPRYNNFYEKNKSRTKSGKITKNTIILGILFTVLMIATCVLFAIK